MKVLKSRLSLFQILDAAQRIHVGDVVWTLGKNISFAFVPIYQLKLI